MLSKGSARRLPGSRLSSTRFRLSCGRACLTDEKEYLNKRWYEYTDLSSEQGRGRGWKVVVHPDDLDRLLREWLALVDARKPGLETRQAALARGLPFEIEQRARRKDGQYRWFLILP
jgi:PAS domain-containing protein